MILRLPISSEDNLEQSTLKSDILNMVRFTIRNPLVWGKPNTHSMNCHEELTDIQSGSMFVYSKVMFDLARDFKYSECRIWLLMN